MGRPSSRKRRMKNGRAGHRQCAGEQGTLLVFATWARPRRREDLHLSAHLPSFACHLLAPCREHLQCCGWISLRPDGPGLAEREGRWPEPDENASVKMTLAKDCEHLRGRKSQACETQRWCGCARMTCLFEQSWQQRTHLPAPERDGPRKTHRQ